MKQASEMASRLRKWINHPACAAIAVQTDLEEVAAYLDGLSDEPNSPQAPIAKITVRESGAGHYAPNDVSVSLYAPGLPPGDHDLYCEPEAVAPYMRAAKSAEGQYCVVHNTMECPFCQPPPSRTIYRVPPPRRKRNGRNWQYSPGAGGMGNRKLRRTS